MIDAIRDFHFILKWLRQTKYISTIFLVYKIYEKIFGSCKFYNFYKNFMNFWIKYLKIKMYKY